ncbi:MAG: hypothetical protein Q8S09_11645, partial [Hyphomonas sp.]|nr:hypothetical protein [Hyphomonas sp.]
GVPAGRGSVSGTIWQARAALRGAGWHIAAIGGGVFRLTQGEDPAGRAKHAPRRTGPRVRASRAGQDSKPAANPAPEPQRMLPGNDDELSAARRRSRIQPPAGGCQYIAVSGGKAVPCGAPAKGNYCEAHRLKTAPAGGFASAAGSAVLTASGRRK